MLMCADNNLFVAVFVCALFFLGFWCLLLLRCCGVPLNYKIPRPGVLSLSFSSLHDF